MQFKQSPWMKSYIDFNTEKRRQEKTDFERDFYKLLNNSMFGKTMENVRNRVNVVLCDDANKAKKLVAQPTDFPTCGNHQRKFGDDSASEGTHLPKQTHLYGIHDLGTFEGSCVQISL